MPYKRGKVFSISMNEDDKLLLETLAKRHKLPQKEIIGYLVGLCDKYNLMSGDWQARLEDLDEDLERTTRREGSCPALAYAEKSHWCLWGRDGKTPDKKKLAKDFGEALEMCAACKITLNIKLENESYQIKVQELEAKLNMKAKQKFKVPNCGYGARLIDEHSFSGCRLNPGKLVDVKNYCKVRLSGKPCTEYHEILIGVGEGETADTDAMK